MPFPFREIRLVQFPSGSEALPVLPGSVPIGTALVPLGESSVTPQSHFAPKLVPSGTRVIPTTTKSPSGLSVPSHRGWFLALVWTLPVGLALWWLSSKDPDPSVWVFLEKDLIQPGFRERLESILRSDAGLQILYPWLMLGPYLVLVAWFFPPERPRLRRNLVLNLVAGALFVAAGQWVHLRTDFARRRLVMIRDESASAPGLPPALGEVSVDPGTASSAAPPELRPGGLGPRPAAPPQRRWSLRSLLMDLLACGTVVGVTHSFRFHNRLKERESRAWMLESRLAQARLQTLKAQLQPHFLFNSLNAVTALLHRDPKQAEATLVALSDLLRLALRRSEAPTGSLEEELEFVRLYLAIQRTRFGERLWTEEDIDPATRDRTVPALVLQPLVENALRHGLEPSEEPGGVRVSARREGDRLVLVVEDDGVGLRNADESNRNPGTGVGLANLRERLLASYGPNQRLELKARSPRGVVARVEIPWEPQVEADGSLEAKP